MTSLLFHHHAIRRQNHFSTPEFPIGADVLGRGQVRALVSSGRGRGQRPPAPQPTPFRNAIPWAVGCTARE